MPTPSAPVKGPCSCVAPTDGCSCSNRSGGARPRMPWTWRCCGAARARCWTSAVVRGGSSPRWVPAAAWVLGIDVSEAAVARTVALGGQALRRSVFESLPGEGRWGTALLIDGNVGIGGDPPALLDRMSQLLSPGGLLIAETVADPDIDERVQVRVTDARGATGDPFPWARSAARPCCGTRPAPTGHPWISGRRAAVPSCPCAFVRRRPPPSHRTARPSPAASGPGSRPGTGRSRRRSGPRPAR